MPLRTLSYRAALPSLLAMAILLTPALGAAQSPPGLQVAVSGDAAEIGRDLVLYLAIDAPDGTTPALDDLQIDVTTPGAPGTLAAPYPPRAVDAGQAPESLRVGAGTLLVEWAAPVPAGTPSGEVELRVAVGGAEWTGTLAVGYGEEWSADKITDFIERRGMALFLLVVFGFGLLMSLSPCIYPMIPITLAVIGSRAQEKGALHGLLMSTAYVLGMALVYAILGALSATVFSGINAFMQSPAVLVPIALLLLFLSFSMFGAYELEAPAFLRDRLQGGGGGGGRGGVIGVFLMGMVAGLVASPCVGPFLAALLVWVATTGNWVLGFFSLFTFGIGMGLLLIGVGTFPALLGSMPQSGGWMETVRRSMGLLLVAMAFFFVRPGLVLPETTFWLLVSGSGILLAVFLGAFDSLGAEARWWDRTRKALGLMAFVAALLTVWSTAQRAGWLGSAPAPAPAAQEAAPNPVASAAVPAPALPDKVQWTKIHTGENVSRFLEEQFAAAKAAGKPVMIDFFAEWCKLCHVLDKKVWNDPDVVAEAQRFVTLKIDATRSDEEMDRIWEEFQVAGLPTIVFIDSRGEVLLGRSANFKPAAEMLELMQSIR